MVMVGGVGGVGRVCVRQLLLPSTHLILQPHHPTPTWWCTLSESRMLHIWSVYPSSNSGLSAEVGGRTGWRVSRLGAGQHKQRFVCTHQVGFVGGQVGRGRRLEPRGQQVPDTRSLR